MHNYKKTFFVFLFGLAASLFVFNGADARSINAPTLIEPRENTITTEAKPLIKGLTASGTLVHIYIDGIYNGKTNYLSDESGTADFAYKPYLGLESGSHRVWVMAEDKAGRQSQPSNILSFKVELPVSEVITAPKIKKKQTEIEKEAETATFLESRAEEDKILNEDEEIRKIIGGSHEETKEDTGLVDENEEKQSKLSPNLIIFILFLIGVIGWILWVNRELIKEKSRGGKEENDSQNQQ